MNPLKQLTEHAVARRLGPWLPFGIVTLVGLAVLWPVPLGRMPLSTDHTVHLTRIWLWAQELAGGSLRGWSPVWFFGAPVGELYPVAGDAIIILVRVLSLGLMGWDTAYAVGFSLVFLIQGWAMLLAARRFGLGPVAGVVAALLLLTDVGQYREGGWIYTVQYGVWPQALATALLWWALAEAFAALRSEGELRGLGRAGLLLGASILAHPMTLPVATAGGLALAGTLIARDPRRMRPILARGAVMATLGIGVAAWWLFPMLQNRAWMASYGWLYMPLKAMTRQAMDGALAQNVVAPVTLLATIGTVGALADRGGAWRFIAGTSLVLWFAASSDAFWSFRLDRVSEGFTHIQYQRFLSAAKPGFFLLAGATLGFAARRATQGPPPLRAAAAAVLAGGSLWTGTAQLEAMREAGVGQAQVHRFGEDGDRAAAYEDLRRWLADQWDTREAFYRVAMRTSRGQRNLHWFMDLPVGSGVPLYKMGFTPGDNFVHKPESRHREVLSALGVRHVIHARKAPGRDEVAAFGPFGVTEQPDFSGYRPAWIEGHGEVAVDELDLEAGLIRGRLSGTSPSSRIVFAVAGYPRWELTIEDQEVDWVETPVWGDGPDATQEQRRGGELRGGKVHGDDGTEPILIAAPARDGSFELRYRSTRLRDLLWLLLSLLGIGACTALAMRPSRVRDGLERIEIPLRRAAHPVAVLAVGLALVVFVWQRWSGNADRERGQATGWVSTGQVEASGQVFTGPLKAGMMIRPAVRARPGESTVVFRGVPGQQIDGWVALDDDSTKLRARGTWTVAIEVRGPDGEWAPVREMRVPHRPGLHPLQIETPHAGSDVRVTLRSRDRPPPIGFDLTLGEAP